MKKAISFIWAIILMFVFVMSPVSTAKAKAEDGDKLSFRIVGTDHYDYAFDVLSELNSMRKNVGLSALKMDKELLEVAMQRAAEIAVCYSHVRPDGTSCFSATPDGQSHAENIAINYVSPEKVMQGWAGSSGHYKNMMNSSYKSVGIGCFEASDGTLCWVQYFSGKTAEKITVSGAETVVRTIDAIYGNVRLSLEVMGLKKSAELGDTFRLRIINTNIAFTGVQQEIKASDFDFSVSDDGVVEVDEDGICTVKGAGDIVFTATLRSAEDISLTEEREIGQVHSYTEYVYNDDATCRKNGTKTAECDCGCGRKKTLTVYGTKKAHTYTDWVITESSSCTEGDKKIKTCTQCGYKIIRTSPADGHISDAGRVTREPTYTRTGLVTYKCRVCGEVIRNEKIDMLALGKTKGLSVSDLKAFSFRLSWNKTDGAKKYRIYRYTSKGWKRIKTVTGTSYTVKNLKSATTYKFKIIPIIDSDNVGKSSDVISVTTRPKKPDVKLKSGAKKITVTWEKVTRAKGYVIEYSLSEDFSSKKTVTVSKGAALKATLKGLKKGKRYYVRVRSYKTVDNKKVYSFRSDVKSVKVK